MGMFSKLFSRKNAVVDPVRQETSYVSTRPSLEEPWSSFSEVEVPMKQLNETVLVGIDVFPSDEQVVFVLAGERLASYYRGQSFETGFDSYIRFATIKLSGEDPAELAEIARKLRALHDLRAQQGKVYEVILWNLALRPTDKNVVFSEESGVQRTYMKGTPEAGKFTYEHIKFTGKNEAAVNKEAAKIKEIHLERANEARKRAIATIAKLNL